MKGSSAHILLYCHHTLTCQARSGIQRVVVEAARALAPLTKVELVKWDEQDGQLRYLTQEEIDQVFGDNTPKEITANRYCARVNYRFGDTIENPTRSWLLFPEIAYLQQNGNDKFARLLSLSKAYGVRTACIFYDLIPVRDPDYMEYKKLHIEYLLEILRCDRIIAISQFSAKDLLAFYASILPTKLFSNLDKIVTAVLLGERGTPALDLNTEEEVASTNIEKRIVLFGTIEPRKQQTRYLRIFNNLLDVEPRLRDYSIDIFGSLHPCSAEHLKLELRRNPRINYHSYASDQTLRSSLSNASYSVFISRNEGYGLPIVESLHLGVPCLCSGFDAMAEVAEGGGCLLVDSLSDEAIAEGILLLACEPEVLVKLRKQARARNLRTWTDYARDLISKMPSDLDGNLTNEINACIYKILNSNIERTFIAKGTTWLLVKASNFRSHDNYTNTNLQYSRTLCVIDWSLSDLGDASNEMLNDLCRPDILAFTDSAVLAAFPHRLRERDIMRLPTAHVGVISLAQPVGAWLSSSVATLSMHTRQLDVMSKQESMLSHGARALSKDLPLQEHQLAIIISTYNRSIFCELNVAWLLKKLYKYGSRVHLVVVDNASTDDTVARLEAYRGDSNFTLVVNPSNTGMLGNLHICSTLHAAKHVWLIGDDDFIHDHAIDSVLETITANPRVPLISTNFEVYFRKCVTSGDGPEQFLREGQNITPNAPTSGPIEIGKVNEYHDNIFTAIYPIIFRDDLMAACFNYMFNGEPFQNLVESVPTTKFILDFLAHCEGYWLSKPGITGNAHNSWTRHRPRWHRVLVPQIIQLARDSGLPPEIGWKWLNVHSQLFEEAASEAIASGIPINLSVGELNHASWLFREG